MFPKKPRYCGNAPPETRETEFRESAFPNRVWERVLRKGASQHLSLLSQKREGVRKRASTAREQITTPLSPHQLPPTLPRKHRLLSVFPFHNTDIVFPTFFFFSYRLLIGACCPIPLQLVLLPSNYRFVTVGFSPPHVARAHYRFL